MDELEGLIEVAENGSFIQFVDGRWQWLSITQPGLNAALVRVGGDFSLFTPEEKARWNITPVDNEVSPAGGGPQLDEDGVPVKPPGMYRDWPPMREETLAELGQRIIKDGLPDNAPFIMVPDWDKIEEYYPPEGGEHGYSKGYTENNPAPEGLVWKHKGGGRFDLEEKEILDGYDTEEEGIAHAQSKGFRNYRMVEGSDGRWHIQHQDPADPKGQVFADFYDAQDNTPPGHRPKQRTDGMWVYERAPVSEAQRISSFDELFWKTFEEKGAAAAMEVDAWRDAVEGQNVSKFEALKFASQFALEDGSNLVELAQLILDFTSGSSFATDLQNAAAGLQQANAEALAPLTQQQTLDAVLAGINAGDGAQTAAVQGIEGPSDDPFATSGVGSVPFGGVPDNESVARAFADAAGRAAVENADPDDEAESERIYNEAFAAEFEARQASVSERETASPSTVADPFADVEFGVTQDENGDVLNVQPTEDGGARTEFVSPRLTDEQYASQVEQARAGYKAAVAAGTNFATDENGNRVELTEKDYLPTRESDRIIVEDADPSYVKAIQRPKKQSTASSGAPKANDGLALQSAIDEGMRQRNKGKNLAGAKVTF